MKQILVIVPPGRLQEGLQVLLATLPRIDVVIVANANAAEAQMAQRPPQLVIIVGCHAEKTLAALIENNPQTLFLFLVEHARQKAVAEAAGADAVLVEGTTAERLLDVVRDLLADRSHNQMEAKP